MSRLGVHERLGAGSGEPAQGKKSISHRRKSMPDFSEQEYQDYVGNNPFSFVPYFVELDAAGGKFKFSWVWPAFFFQFIWFYYRKMYLWGTVNLLLRPVPVINVLSMLVMPMLAKYLYYRNAQKKLSMLRQTEGTCDPQKIREMGGVSVRVAWICVGLIILSFFLIVFLFNIYSIEHLRGRR
jgi:hypothetical protein